MSKGKTSLYEDLKRRILLGDLEPDMDLDEIELSESYGISRTPVREVFRQLEGEGYITIQHNKGARVTPMNSSTLRSFFQVAPMIYAAIGRLAVQNYKAQQLQALIEVQARFRRASIVNDPDEMVLTNNRFHNIMGEMAHNVYLFASLRRLEIDHARIGHRFYRPDNEDMQRRLLKSVEHHDGFIEALKNYNESAVVELVFEHWELSRENMEMFIAPKSMSEDVALVKKHRLTENVE